MIDWLVLMLAVAGVTALALHIWRRIAGPASSRVSRGLRGLASFAAALVITGLGAWKFANARTIQAFGDIVPRVETADSVVAITFDDGPLPGTTQQILAVLDDADVRASFFLIGEAIARNRGEANAIVDAGHEVGNHTFTHPIMIGRSLRAMRGEIDRTDAEIRATGYEGPIHFRSPYGKKLAALPWVLWRAGRSNIFFDVEPETWPDIAGDSARIVEHVLANTRPGSIILMHVMTRHYEPSLRAVPAILDGLKDRGYRFVTVSELLAHRS